MILCCKYIKSNINYNHRFPLQHSLNLHVIIEFKYLFDNIKISRLAFI